MLTRLLTALSLAALAAFVGACRSDIVNRTQSDCPAQEPIGGEPCDSSSTCGYDDSQGSPCGRAYACMGGVWQFAGSSCPDPPPPGACPTALPTMAAPCKSLGQACDFDFPGDCEGVFVATCTSTGWSVEDKSPPCMPHPCPMDEPMAGAPCDYPYSCTYVVTPPGCPAETQDATCVGGAWTITTPGTCGMP